VREGAVPVGAPHIRPPRPSFRGTVLKASTRVIREEMCTKGLHAVVHGREWHAEHGGVWVTLLPRCGCR
jgi:hypothetical protein